MSDEELEELREKVLDAHRKLIIVNHSYNLLLTFDRGALDNDAQKRLTNEIKMLCKLIKLLSYTACLFFILPGLLHIYPLAVSLVFVLIIGVTFNVAVRIINKKSKRADEIFAKAQLDRDALYEKLTNARSVYNALKKEWERESGREFEGESFDKEIAEGMPNSLEKEEAVMMDSLDDFAYQKNELQREANTTDTSVKKLIYPNRKFK